MARAVTDLFPDIPISGMAKKSVIKQIKWLMQFIENEGFAYGYWKLTRALRKYKNLIINNKKFYCLYKKEEIKILRLQRKSPTEYYHSVKNKTIEPIHVKV